MVLLGFSAHHAQNHLFSILARNVIFVIIVGFWIESGRFHVYLIKIKIKSFLVEFYNKIISKIL